ncbi:PTS IIA-like nitrogen regulatory protein PtsN [Plasticicumulans acidivorans]|uniref:Phosphotransferase IIA-like nitrogen-regulatory protein PtsN n=1 Tax=Plasticicumulans acidivorans TaxID=886464 RepID=A0A317MUV9_9GAMM|nr:PTS IIA-like nitrogen regulatory protein PtsN [Plasticicumulans acidivorans]PWV61796.1 phosphotransferase IIA-like nitrogen-regulatory protein PtsN [Plasticicumulans acidivorans]
MNITELLSTERVVCSHDVASKKRVLDLVSELIAAGGDKLDSRAIFDSLVGRERLGSTGLGNGVALPHGRLGGTEHALGAFIRLAKGVDFDAIDQQPVDLVFALLVPEHFTDEHLKILAYLAEMFSDRVFCERLRATTADAELYTLLTRWTPSDSIMT